MLKRKKWLVIADLEGIIGMRDIQDFSMNERLLSDEINRAIRAIEIYDPACIFVADIHDRGNNIVNVQRLERGVTLLRGISELVSSEYNADYCILLGFHSMAGGLGRFPHTFREDICCACIGGRKVGEVGLFSRWLAGRGTRILLVSGEGNFCDELGKETMYHIVTDRYDHEVEVLRVKLQHLKDYTIQVEKVPQPVEIYFYNKDYLALMEHFDDCIEDGLKLIYENVDVFFRQLPELCKKANRLKQIIIRRNTEELLRIKSLYHTSELRKLENEVFSKDVAMVTLHDLNTVRKILEENYRDR